MLNTGPNHEQMQELIRLGIAEIMQEQSGAELLEGEEWTFLGCEQIKALSPEERARLGLEEMYEWCVENKTA